MKYQEDQNQSPHVAAESGGLRLTPFEAFVCRVLPLLHWPALFLGLFNMGAGAGYAIGQMQPETSIAIWAFWGIASILFLVLFADRLEAWLIRLLGHVVGRDAFRG